MAVDTSREAVERLALRMEGIARQTTVYASLDRAHAGDAAATLRALLARAEAAERREGACTLLTGTPGALTVNCIRGAVRCTERERIETQRDAAIAERDRLAEALEGTTAAVQAEREACAEACERKRVFAAAGGPHTCTTINGALWYGREQYAADCRDAIRARGPADALAEALTQARREGMEKAAEIAKQCGNFGDYARDELTIDFGQPRFDMMNAIILAIRCAAGEVGK